MKTNTKKKPFHRLTAAQKRVAVARDAIAQLNQGRFIADHGHYISLDRKTTEAEVIDQKLLTSRKQITCRVCVTGAAALSYIRKFNRKTLPGEFCMSQDVAGILSKVFTPAQLGLMEIAYEGQLHGMHFTCPDFNAGQRAEDFREKYKGGTYAQADNDRVVAIFQNIIDNKGTFKP